MRKSALFAFAPAVAASITLAGWGGPGGGRSHSSAAHGKAGGPAVPTITLAPSTFGEILVDIHGRALYESVADKTTATTRSGRASLWPPLIVSETPKAGPQIRAALLGTAKRADHTEVTRNGHPLYSFAGDAKAAESTGRALNQSGTPWYVLTVNGTAVHNG